MITGQYRGHKIVYINNAWRYADNEVLIEEESRPCVRCGRMPTPEGYDACLGHIEGATGACCGHGVQKKMVMYE